MTFEEAPASRQEQSRKKLEMAICYCKQIYAKHEKEKGDSWRDMLGAELWRLWEQKLEQIKNDEDEERNAEMENLADLVNLTLTIMVKFANPKEEYFNMLKRSGLSDQEIKDKIDNEQEKSNITELEALQKILASTISGETMNKKEGEP